jgi:SNF2 family DNA or RNA helicase
MHDPCWVLTSFCVFFCNVSPQERQGIAKLLEAEAKAKDIIETAKKGLSGLWEIEES